MQFQLLGDWPATGSLCVPAGTMIDGNDPRYLGEALPSTMPMNAKALDQDAADAMSRWYPHHLYLLHAAAGVQIKKLIHV